MNKFFSNEADFHQQVINGIDRLPNELKARDNLHIFVWAHEVKLLDAGQGGGDGLADLLTVDEEGRIWLIEVKLGKNPELRSFVWKNQLARYREAIEIMTWQRLITSSEAFLKGRERTKPTGTISPQAKSFVDALTSWQKRIGRTLVPPDELNHRMADAINTGTYGIMVLADQQVQEVKEFGKRFLHDGPLAYVKGIPTSTGVDFRLLWHRPGNSQNSSTRILNPDPRFDAWETEVNRKCDPKHFAETLSEGSRKLWLEVLRPGLVQLGWDGRPETIKDMSFNVGFEVKGKLVPLLVVGWSELDAKDVSRQNKLAEQASMKINPRLKQILNTSGDISLVNRFAKHLYSLGWRGRPSRGMDKSLGVIPVSADELNATEGVMIYRPDKFVRDHVGQPGDKESLEGLLRELKILLDELHRS